MAETAEEFRERMRSIAVMRPGCELQRVNAKERQWARDMDAFKAEHQAGHMPAHIDGCADRIARATSYEDYAA